MRKVMTPEHKRWSEFAERLAGPEACNFNDEGDTWICFGDHRFATTILGDMSKQKTINIQRSIEYFEDHGGHCDCEILFNIDTE